MLLTEFVTIGTAGATVDGREIDEQHLKDMAEQYDPDIYTAVINGDHQTWYGNLGSVKALRLSKNKQGKTSLEAQLRPNARLISFNQAGQKLFTSMEIKPNFSDTGKAYLTGLAVTDNPASLSTTMLQLFSANADKKNVSLSSLTEFNLGIDSGESETKTKTVETESMLKRLFESFGFTQKNPEKTIEPNQEVFEMNEEQLAQFNTQQKEQADVLSKLSESVVALTAAVVKMTAEPEKEEGEQAPAITLESLSEKLEAAEKANIELKAKVDELSEEMPAQFSGGNEGDAGQPKEFI